MTSLQFANFAENDVTNLWCAGAGDKDWPEELMPFDTFRNYVANGIIANHWSSGQVKGIFTDGHIIGFTSLHEAESGLFPNHVFVFEGGTYLLPIERGKDLNRQIKMYLLRTAFNQFNCNWCIFCIPEHNERAIFAIEKLSFPFERVTLHNTNHPLFKYLKWKTWKQNTSLILYGIHQEKYKDWSTSETAPVSQ